LSGQALLLLPVESGLNFAQLCTGLQQPAAELDLELRSALLEVGGVLLGTILTAVSLSSRDPLRYGMPELRQVNQRADWPSTATSAVLRADLTLTVRQQSLPGHLLILCEDNSLDALLQRLAV
jgi:chemotaxis protein CheY-P-specific phosphatase CheC